MFDFESVHVEYGSIELDYHLTQIHFRIGVDTVWVVLNQAQLLIQLKFDKIQLKFDSIQHVFDRIEVKFAR